MLATPAWIWCGEINVGGVGVEVVFKGMRSDEITKGVSVVREEKTKG